MKKILSLIILTALMASCEMKFNSDGGIDSIEPTSVQADTLPCATEALPKDGDVDAARKSLSGKRLGLLSSTTAVIIHRERWVQRFNKDTAKTINHFRPIFERIAKRDLERYGVQSKFVFYISKPNEFTLNGTTSTFQAQLRKNYPRMQAHKILFVGWGANGGIAVQGGGGIPGNNYATVVVTPGNSSGGYEENDINHELKHLDGVPHSHSYVHTVDGVSFQALENYGQVYFPTVAGALRGSDVQNPKVGGKYSQISATSYEASKYLPYSLNLHPLHVPLFLDKVATYTDAHNTAENLRYENGSIKYDDKYSDRYQVRIGTFKNGKTSWGNWQEFPDGEKAVNIPLTRPYSSSGNTGYRYEYDYSKFDYVKAVVDPAVVWYCSWGNPDSGKKDFPKDGIFKLPAGASYLQLRPAVSKTAKPISVTGYKKSGSSRELPVKLSPGFYYLEIQNVKGGAVVKSGQITVK